MVTYPLDRLKIETISECLTSYAGLATVATLFQSLHLPQTLNTALADCKERKRGYDPATFVLSLALTSIAGGDCLDDIRLLYADAGLKKLLNIKRFPAANTLGEFLRGFNHRRIKALAQTNLSFVHRLLCS